MKLTPRWAHKVFPVTSPYPGMTFTVPAGKPTSYANLPRASGVSGACSAGFKTTVFTAINAGAIFHTAWRSG